jgi:hypothetical protein
MSKVKQILKNRYNDGVNSISMSKDTHDIISRKILT